MTYVVIVLLFVYVTVLLIVYVNLLNACLGVCVCLNWLLRVWVLVFSVVYLCCGFD